MAMIKHSTWTRLGDVVNNVGQLLVVAVALLIAAGIALAVGTAAALALMDLIGRWS